MNGTKYWRERFSILEDAQHRKADRSLQEIEQIYKDVQMSIQQDIERWYGRFAANNGITLAEARKILSKRDLEEFRWTVDQYIAHGQQAHLNPQWMKQLENASARYHISRLEALQLQIQQQTELLYGNQLDEMDKLLRDVVGNGYTRALFAVQKGLGVAWDSTALDPRRLDLLLSRPWTADKKTFRDRCWDQKTDLTSRLQRRMTTGILRGDSLQRMTDDFSHEIGVARSRAARLIHTETTYFNGVANQEMYKDIGVEEVEILVTLDTYTCGECSPLDGLRVKMVDYEPGVTVPPFHPNCRCTTIPAIDDEEDPEEIGQRAARLNEDEGGDGKTYYVPEDMNYSEWKKKFLGGGDKSDLVQTGPDWNRDPSLSSKGFRTGNSLNGYQANEVKDIQTQLKNAPAEVREVYKKYGSSLQEVDENVDLSISRAYFDPSDGRVHLHKADAAAGSYYQTPYQMHFHEYGHNLDYLAGNRKYGSGNFTDHYRNAAGQTFEEVIMDEWDTRMKSHYIQHPEIYEDLVNKATKADAQLYISQQMQIWRASNGISRMSSTYQDLLSEFNSLNTKARYKKFWKDHKSLFQNQVFADARKETVESFIDHILNTYPDERTFGNLSDMFEKYSYKYARILYPFKIGHGDKNGFYFGKTGALSHEAFAEMMDASIANQPSIDLIKKYLPDSYQMFLEILKEMVK